ncbi:MAG: formylglycine-generating enzyme family protein [Bacteroidales bacterium]|nr:formylglycine-generating enzyme family protein [Bacteroidales bacterium]
MVRKLVITGLALLFVLPLTAQELKTLKLRTNKGLEVSGFQDNSGKIHDSSLPLISFRLGEVLVDTRQMAVVATGDSTVARLDDRIEMIFKSESGFAPGWKGTVKIRNLAKKDTLEIWNVVPFGEAPDKVYITGFGRHSLSRTHLSRPGMKPVNVIVPDNAWNLGFSESVLSTIQIAALSRRTSSEKAKSARFETNLYPGGSVTYALYADTYTGAWQEGLRLMFQKRMLYDLDKFDNTLYDREDLKWIRHTYASHLIYAWDHQYWDSKELKNNLQPFLDRGKKWYGGDDFIGIWPTWPSLGLDQRNQWDLFRDLPGGLKGLSQTADLCRANGSRFFICYNPWDEDTRSESHYTGMAALIKEVGADGVVLDTKGSSSVELQHAADSVRKGVIMYSEGMAVPKDMPGIVSGRVHNALYYPPMLNLNKLIKPDFAIFRVAELAFEPIRREYATSFFNGYGTELNIFKPGRPDWIEADYRFFGQTLRILRENTTNFTDYNFVPLIPTLRDQIFVNCWPGNDKLVYTIFSLIPEGFDGALFEAPLNENHHWVDVWEHREIKPETIGGKTCIPVRTDAFHQSWLGTNNEGAVSAVVLFPSILKVNLNIDQLTLSASTGDKIRIWAGDPDYEKKPALFDNRERTIRLGDYFGRFEGDFIIQLFRNDEILDERIVTIKPGSARLVSQSEPTDRASKAPQGMVVIPKGSFTWKTTHGDDFIGYPDLPVSGPVQVNGFYMDKYPVTNRQYQEFILTSGYQPADTINYLKNWVHGKPAKGTEKYPVVYVSYEDAKAYAKWAGKRLPTEMEWQYAAQTSDLRPWPWGEGKGVTRETETITNTLTVSRLKGIDSKYCNTGIGKMEPVGRHPKGINPFGLEDLVGSVWQLTNDEYDDGTVYYVIMKGGSYFNPSSSWWYVQGGPRELHYRQMLLRVSRGFERNSTVGFRCIKDW